MLLRSATRWLKPCSAKEGPLPSHSMPKAQLERKTMNYWKHLCNTAVLLVLILALCPGLSAQKHGDGAVQKGVWSGLIGQSGKDPVKIATLNNFPPFSFTVQGKLMGFTIDYIELLGRKTGLELEIVEGTWEQNLRRFKKGQVDLITAMSYMEERTSFTRFTEPYYIIPTVVYIREDSFSYQGVKDLKGKTVGIESGVFYKSYLQDYPKIKLQEIEDTNALLRQLSFGEIDAVLTNINIGNYMIKKHMLENVVLAGRIDIPGIKDEDLRIGVRRELSGLHSLIQGGMNQISPREYKALQDRWVGFSPREMLKGNLLPEEYQAIKQYEEKHGGLRLACQTGWHPIDFFDAHNRHQGIAAGIFERIGKKQNISFLKQKTGSLRESVDAVARGEAEVIPAVVPTRQLSNKLSFTKPYLSLPLVIATRSSEIFIEDLSLVQGKRIGFIKRGVLGSTLRKKYPELRFEEAASVREGLQRVRERRDFAFVGTIPAITYAIQNHNFYNIKVSGTLPEKLALAAAVRKDNNRLLHIVQKALHSISLQQREKVVDNWISIRFDERVDYTLLWGVVGGAALVVVLIILWTRKVQAFNARISEANQLLEEKNRQLEHLSVTDKLTGLYNRSKVETELEQEKKRFERTGSEFSIIILDIDWFKSINDTYGHVAGDQVLREIAGLISSRTRETDIVGRWGGEEFLLLCPETDPRGAEKLAEDIRKDIEAHSFGVQVRVTVSAGVATYTREDLGEEGLVRLADEMLYKAKEQKNIVLRA